MISHLFCCLINILWCANYHVAKYQPAQALWWRTSFSKKINDQHHRSKNFDWAFQRWRYPHTANFMIPTDMSFQFKRLRFPIRLAFAIMINKAQGQCLELCGLYLHTDCFSHGQLYVACSRQSLYLHGNWNYQEYCVFTSIGKLNILETCIFIFFSPFKQTEPQQRVTGYS